LYPIYFSLQQKYNGLDRVFWGFKQEDTKNKFTCKIEKRSVQKEAWTHISNAIDDDNKNAILLHMGTGTGKTFLGIETAFKLAGKSCEESTENTDISFSSDIFS
jgi:type I site-specific restriction endonuclease